MWIPFNRDNVLGPLILDGDLFGLRPNVPNELDRLWMILICQSTFHCSLNFCSVLLWIFTDHGIPMAEISWFAQQLCRDQRSHPVVFDISEILCRLLDLARGIKIVDVRAVRTSSPKSTIIPSPKEQNKVTSLPKFLVPSRDMRVPGLCYTTRG